jgi:hypothetical protein
VGNVNGAEGIVPIGGTICGVGCAVDVAIGLRLQIGKCPIKEPKSQIKKLCGRAVNGSAQRGEIPLTH